MALGTAGVEAYQRDGFALARGLVDADTLRRIDARFQALVLGHVPAPARLVVMKDVAFAKRSSQPKSPLHSVNKILNFEDDSVLWRFVTDPRVLECVRELIGPELNTLATNVINKPPGVDGRHPLHQDLRYIAMRPADAIVGTWTAIQACTRENGCLAVIPGSHRNGLAEHVDPGWQQVNSEFLAAQNIDRDARVHLEMEPGDTLFFHPLLVHGSGRNRTDGFRRAISIHYASVECRSPETSGRRIATATKRVPSA